MESMYFNSVWELVDLPEGVKPIGCKWIHKRKRDSARKVQTFKARLVAKVYTQREGVDYEETFSPIAMLKSIRILLSIFTFYDYEIWQMDVKTGFLNDNLEESIFMFDTAIKSYDFDQNVDEPCVYKKINKGKVAFLVLYVDDILLIGNDVGYLIDVKAWLAVQFQMKDLEEAQYVLGIQIIRDCKIKTLALSQATYIDKMLVRYSMQNFKKDLLLFRHGVHLSKEQCPKKPQEVENMRRILYVSVVGSLIYVMLCTRPNICYAVGIVSRYQSNLGLDHWTVVKIILKYLKRMRDYMLVIKQGCIADSTMEAEYVAACEAAKEVVWLRKFLHDLEVNPNMNLPITLYCDNSGAVANPKQPRSHKRGKRIERKYHLIREIVQRGDVIITKIASEHNIADPFTKTLTAKVFEGHLESLGLRDMYIR
ncbi:gag/pol protein [Cucumis melo var. makuwa]|uniref:Gag/pol protein n=1 Tax=Cucumis melo var. makuwa TaxID=1194695 RepID=A0A5D3BF83_CUCMM|nr:gag/pol protein [Cucumis melo var. makuwa]TYJ97787.1 gag/pol protein [Cucumis melo var. makuwa]